MAQFAMENPKFKRQRMEKHQNRLFCDGAVIRHPRRPGPGVRKMLGSATPLARFLFRKSSAARVSLRVIRAAPRLTSIERKTWR